MMNTSHSLPFRFSTLAVCIITALHFTPSQAFAVEPAIRAAGGVSLGLRNDGVLLQLGGQPFTPISLDGTVAVPIQANAAILDHVSSLPLREPQDEFGNANTLTTQRLIYDPGIREMKKGRTTIGRAVRNNTLFAWEPTTTEINKAQPTQAVPDFKQRFLDGDYEVIINSSGNAFSFIEPWIVLHPGGILTQIPGLTEVKKVVGIQEFYLALTQGGNVFQGKWDWWNSQQFTSATQVEGLSGITDIAVYRDRFLTLTESGQVWMWRGNPPTTPILVGGISNVVNILSGASNFALTSTGEVYTWTWDNGTQAPTSATLVTSGMVSIAGSAYNSSYFSLSTTGQLYRLREGNATNINVPSPVKSIKSYDYTGYHTFITDSGEVYFWNDQSDTVNQITGLSQVKQILGTIGSGKFLALTTDKKVYQWDSNATSATQVSDWNDAIAIAVSEGGLDISDHDQSHFLVLREDGNVCGWGNNSSGQLGAHHPSFVDTPVCGIEDLNVATGEVYSLNVIKAGSGQGSVTTSLGKINCGSVCTDSYLVGNKVTLKAHAEPSFQFSGWNGGCQGRESETQITIQGATECTATFEPVPPSTLTIQKSGLGSGTVTASVNGTSTALNCGSTCTESYPTGSLVTLNATPAADSKFVRWNGEGCSDQIKLTENRNCTATFALLSVPTLTIDQNNGGRVVSTPAGIDCSQNNRQCSAQFPEGTKVKLKVIPETGFVFGGWWGEWSKGGDQCYGNNPLSVTMDKDRTCNVSYSVGGGTPNIGLWQTAFNFEAPSSTSKVIQSIGIYNNSNNDWWASGQQQTAALQLGNITVDNDAFVVKDTCSNVEVAPWNACTFEVEFHPRSADPVTATLSIPSNDPDTPTTAISLSGTVCSSGNNAQTSFSVYPNPVDFGVRTIGEPTSLNLSVYANVWGETCGMPQIDTVQFTGLHAHEFSVKDQQCYHGGWGGYFSSSCQVTVVFLPVSEGRKEAELGVIFNDPSLKLSPLSIQAQASSESAHIEISPQNIDFGTVSLERSKSEPVIIRNTGDINLKLKDINISGDIAFNIPNLWNCYSYSWGYSSPELAPNGQCQIDPQFAPIEVGDKQAILTVASNDPESPTQIPLKGKAVEPQECLDHNITIESVASGTWGTGSTWNKGSPPTENDVVRIKGGHTIVGTAYAKVKTLCVEPQATLESPDDKGSPLFIQVIDYIQNKGTVRGKDGANESHREECTSIDKLEQGNCAYPGASVYLVTGSVVNKWEKREEWWWEGSGGPIRNEGTIKAGKGGNGSRYAAEGGYAIVLGRNTMNTLSGVIKGGDGGHLLGTLSGQAGKGGATQIWGKLGGPGYLKNYGEVRGGKGGECNSRASEPQIGGNGGNLWLVSLPDVYLKGFHASGQGGRNCSPLGTNGSDGYVQIEPGVISLAGANTKVEGGNVTIFGGKGWVLNLSNLDHPVIRATGDVVLAVGEGGLIDLRGSRQIVLEAQGQVTIFSNSILLDEGRKLSDVIAAKNIVVAPSRILYNVSLNASEKVIGPPAATVPVILVLNNSGPEQDTYVLEVTDSKGWSLGTLPEKMTVEGLSSVETVLNVTLPNTPGEMNRIHVIATSQSDPQVSTAQDIQVGVAMKDSEVMIPIRPTVSSSGGASAPGTSGTSGGTSTSGTSGTSGGTSAPGASGPSGTSSGVGTISAMMNVEGCPPTGVITSLCNNRNRTIRDAKFEVGAKVSGGILAGSINNQGFVSQVTVQPDTELSGGTLSGYITNQGTLRDFTFVGASIYGGTLAGTITNRSKVGGTFIDVTLAPHAHIIGGKLAGDIVGDKDAPALLENVRILAGSYLSGVKLGTGVVREKGVVIEGEEDETPPTVSPPQFAELGQAIAIDEQGQTVDTTSLFKGGIALNQQEDFKLEQHAVKVSADKIEILGHVSVDATHVEQEAEIVVYMTYQASSKDEPIHLMVDDQMNILAWDGVPHSLVAFEKNILLGEEIEVPIYQGMLTLPGIVKIHFGYRLPDGTVVSHSQDIVLQVVE